MVIRFSIVWTIELETTELAAVNMSQCEFLPNEVNTINYPSVI